MSATRELVFDWLFNASVQIGLFAILAAVLSPFLTKAKAKYQHSFYLAVFAVSLTAPALNTFWRAQPSALAENFQPQLVQEREQQGHHRWVWAWQSRAHESIVLTPEAKTALLAIWQALFLYQLIRFAAGIYRVRRLRSTGLPISPGEVMMAGSIIKLPRGVVLLQSTATDDPVTVGVFHPAIILPSKVIPALEDSDLTVILAHEYGHIRRKDFLVLFLCQLIALPVAWHPGVRYLMTKIRRRGSLPAMSTPQFALENQSCTPAHSYTLPHCACKYPVAAQ